MKRRPRSVVIAATAAFALLLCGCEAVLPTTNAAEGAPSADTAKKIITPEAARNLADNCFTCHGPDGRSPGSIPSLTALDASDISSRLRRFKRDQTSSTVMSRLAKGYSDAEIDALANCIAALKKNNR